MTQKMPSYDDYLAALPPDRREAVNTVWGIVRANMRDGFIEEIGEKFLQFKAGDVYYVGLANQKNYVSLYLMCAYASPELKARLESGGTKLKMGKSCINFKRANELPLDVLAEIIAAHDGASWRAQAKVGHKKNGRTTAVNSDL